MNDNQSLILASASPRRAELLESAGFSFTIQPADVDETPLPGEAAPDYVLRVARAKAAAVADLPINAGAIVLAADTAVVADRTILGKPRGRGDASLMLSILSGGTHQVLTGVVMRTGEQELIEVVTTRVHMLELAAAEITWYLATGEYQDKAGSYAIQGRASRFIDWIDGSWSNVVGLPLATVHRMLNELGNPPH